MAYCTVDDIMPDKIPEDELIQLTDDDDAGVVDAGVVEEAIADADAEIDGYCMERYSVPFAPVPVLVRKFSIDISIYNLFSRRQGATEERETRYRDAIRFLKDVAIGKASMGADAPTETSQDTVEVTTSKSDRIFTRDTLKGY